MSLGAEVNASRPCYIYPLEPAERENISASFPDRFAALKTLGLSVRTRATYGDVRARFRAESKLSAAAAAAQSWRAKTPSQIDCSIVCTILQVSEKFVCAYAPVGLYCYCKGGLRQRVFLCTHFSIVSNRRFVDLQPSG